MFHVQTSQKKVRCNTINISYSASQLKSCDLKYKQRPLMRSTSDVRQLLMKRKLLYKGISNEIDVLHHLSTGEATSLAAKVNEIAPSQIINVAKSKESSSPAPNASVQSSLHCLNIDGRLAQGENERNLTAVGETSFLLGSTMGKRLFSYIEEVSHMDDVRKSQERVMQIKERLRDFGENKRNILHQLDDIRHSLQRIHNDLKFNDSKASERYLQLVTEEVDLYRKEKELQMNFKIADEEERILFNAFSAAINDSYEKEKVHTNFIKVWGLIGTLLASAVTLIASVIGHYHHQTKFATLALDFRQDVNNAIDNEVSKKLDSIQQKLHEGIAKLDEQRQQGANIGVNISSQHQSHNVESWGAYLQRHSRWIYGWAIPKN